MQILTVTGGMLQTNCYIAWNEGAEDCVVIDPGFEATEVLVQVRAQGKKVAAILLTHGHFDHVGGATALAEETGCKVYLHKEDLGLPTQMTAGIIPATDYYGEGDVLELAGLTLHVLHTPGHTPGSVCLQCENVIFAGDTLFAGSCGRTDFPGGSFVQMQDSLNRLAALQGDYHVLSGHGQATTLETERRNNPYIG